MALKNLLVMPDLQCIDLLKIKVFAPTSQNKFVLLDFQRGNLQNKKGLHIIDFKTIGARRTDDFFRGVRDYTKVENNRNRAWLDKIMTACFAMTNLLRVEIIREYARM